MRLSGALWNVGLMVAISSPVLRKAAPFSANRSPYPPPTMMGLLNSQFAGTQGLIVNPNLKPRPSPGSTFKCAPKCEYQWLGDQWCDTECANEQCRDDDNDCLGWCAPDCLALWIGDSFCDIDCFREECQYDMGDCNGIFPESMQFYPRQLGESFNYSLCRCDQRLLNNHVCNVECATPECHFDGGDCRHQCHPECLNTWLGDGICDSACNRPECHFDKGDCKACSEGCDTSMIGNGICDRQCDHAGCQFDAGDCREVCWSAPQINYMTEPFFYPHCRQQWIGDGFCDCFCMTPQCDFDMGDCDNVSCSYEHDNLRATYEAVGVDLKDFNPEYNDPEHYFHSHGGLSGGRRLFFY